MSGIRQFMTAGRRGRLVAAALAVGFLAAPAVGTAQEHQGTEVERQVWSFAGIGGHFDQAQLQRGYKVFEETCSKCHSAALFKFRNLMEAGGPGFSEGQVKGLAAKNEIEDGPNDQGEMFKRPAKPSDAFPSPFANDNAARAANGGALPPDLSVLAKARALHSELPWYVAPFHWIKDIASGYQEGGPDYIHAVLTHYKDAAPAGLMDPNDAKKDFKLNDGMYFNSAFPGYQIGMPPPLTDGAVEYTDGTPATVEQYSRDISAFLMWMAEPKLEERKQLGIRVLIYLIILSLLLYLAKRAVWARIKH